MWPEQTHSSGGCPYTIKYNDWWWKMWGEVGEKFRIYTVNKAGYVSGIDEKGSGVQNVPFFSTSFQAWDFLHDWSRNH